MFRELRTTVEFTSSVFQNHRFLRVKESTPDGWMINRLTWEKPVFVFEGKFKQKFAIEMNKTWLYVEVHNPHLFPSYLKINGRALIIKKGESYHHKQNKLVAMIYRDSNTKFCNYYVLVRAE